MRYSLNTADSLKHLSRSEQDIIDSRFQYFLNKNKLDRAHIHMDITETKTRLKGQQGFAANLRLVGDRKDFSANSETYGAMRSVMEALDLLEHQLKTHEDKKARIQQKKKSLKRASQ